MKTIRHMLGITLAEFAHKLGVCERTVVYWETNGKDPLTKAAQLLEKLDLVIIVKADDTEEHEEHETADLHVVRGQLHR